jgi:hypothetical protein
MTQWLQRPKNILSHILGLQVNRFPVFMESESSLPYSQQLDNENYPEPHAVTSQHNTLFFNRHYTSKNTN